MLKNQPVDMQVESEKLMGFYRGVIEDNKDPEKAGRVRVRIFGIHTEKKLKTETEGIPTEELPWAEPCLPLIEGSVSGFGVWSVPVQGSHVMVFFADGNILLPMYFATLPGIPEKKDPLVKTIVTQEQSRPKTEGFRDPDDSYPVQSKLGEPDVHRLARGVSDDTLVTTKEENLDQAVMKAFGGSWDEPSPAFAAQYPHNLVITTHGGLTVELDSTPGAKRFQIYHPSNTYIECDNDGNIVFRNQANKYEITMEGRFVHVLQDNCETVAGDERVKVIGTKYTEINEDENRQVDQTRTTEVKVDDIENIGANKEKTVGGNETKDITGNKDETIGGNESKDVGGNREKTIGGNETVDVGGNKDETIGGVLNITVTGAVNLTSSSVVNITAPRINLN